MNGVNLRNMMESDLALFFQFQKDPEANKLAAFTMPSPDNWEVFSTHWNKILANKQIIKQTILVDEKVVGNILCFQYFDEQQISYWIERKNWGKGIATKALQQFLQIVTIRPLFARCAKDNIGSRKVLEKCKFIISGEDSGFANARGKEVGEFVFTLL